MRKGYLVFLLMLFVLSVGGCQRHIKVEPACIGHEDEIVREGDFVVLADRRIFAVMAFINAMGFDSEVEGKQMHPVRVRVRELVREKAAKHSEEFDKWKQFYKKAKLATFHYQDFALSLSMDYPFRRIRPDSELGYPFTAQRLAAFPTVLNEFWETADLDTIWAEVKPSYLEEIHKYDFDKMKHQLVFIWDYLRMERKDRFVFVSVPNFLDMHYSAIGAKYENYWYMVESPGAGSHGLNVHEYLHSIVNPLVEDNYQAYCEKLNKYFEAGKGQPLAKNYGHPVTYTFECLVRALDHRLRVLLEDNPTTTKRCENRIVYLTQNGLTLVEPFYQLLRKYEQSDKNFERFFPMMLDLLPEYSK